MQKTGRFLSGIIILLICIFNANISSAQIKGMSSLETEKLLQSDMMDNLGSDKLLTTENLLVGNIVNPDYYLVGPGDILAVQNISASIKLEPMVITPENSVLMPRIGTVSLLGMTLKQAKETIIKKILENKPDALVYVTLYKPRSVVVTIKGNVKQSGTYTFPASFRISSAIKYANQERSTGSADQAKMMKNNDASEKQAYYDKLFTESGLPAKQSFVSRNIILLRSGGTNNRIDLERASVLNSIENDPYLFEGDEIYVPYEPREFSTISISGAVIRPYVMPFKESDRASFLLKAGYKLREDADLDNIYFIDQENKKQKITIDSNLNIVGTDFQLSPGCMIIVGQKTIETSRKNGLVSVFGHVTSPGIYPIKRGETKLKDVIKSTGGFTSEAYLPNAYVVRKEYKGNTEGSDRREALDYFRNSDLTMQDTARFFIDASLRKPYVSCNFPALFESDNDKENITLEDGDLIVIPSSPNSVYIYGQVNQPGFIKFEKNKTMEWYIEQAGGFAAGAEKGKARIIRSKNRVWVESSSKTIVMAGDEIYVPSPSAIPPGIEAQNWAAMAGIVTAFVSLINFVIILKNQGW
jgi:protein involved in polysaccharide export with SLBB domain